MAGDVLLVELANGAAATVADLKRGLLGHLFNGYEARFVRPDLKRVKHTKDDPAAGLPRTVPLAAE
jgi:hypothetical protein